MTMKESRAVFNSKINLEFDRAMQLISPERVNWINKDNLPKDLIQYFPYTIAQLSNFGVDFTTAIFFIKYGIICRMKGKHPFWGKAMISRRMFDLIHE